mmetsp:Transcript_105683/g.209988  ORF Transcript_105683/g.209988 Transcript_105683/m.209988 type:complete len:84 (+) Transcript_105683:1498-1749(+)
MTSGGTPTRGKSAMHRWYSLLSDPVFVEVATIICLLLRRSPFAGRLHLSAVGLHLACCYAKTFLPFFYEVPNSCIFDTFAQHR